MGPWREGKACKDLIAAVLMGSRVFCLFITIIRSVIITIATAAISIQAYIYLMVIPSPHPHYSGSAVYSWRLYPIRGTLKAMIGMTLKTPQASLSKPKTDRFKNSHAPSLIPCLATHKADSSLGALRSAAVNFSIWTAVRQEYCPA